MTDRHFLAVVTLNGDDLAEVEKRHRAEATDADVSGALDATLLEVYPLTGDPVRAGCSTAVSLTRSSLEALLASAEVGLDGLDDDEADQVAALIHALRSEIGVLA